MGVYGIPVEYELNWIYGRWLNNLESECPNGMGVQKGIRSNNIDMIFWVGCSIWMVVYLEKYQCQMNFVAIGCFGNCN